MPRSRGGSTIGRNPLDHLLPPPAEPTEPLLPPDGDRQPRAAPALPIRRDRERFTVHLSAALVDRIRDAVYWTPGLTVSAMAESALAAAVTELEATNGRAFPRRAGEVRTGRPVG